MHANSITSSTMKFTKGCGSSISCCGGCGFAFIFTVRVLCHGKIGSGSSNVQWILGFVIIIGKLFLFCKFIVRTRRTRGIISGGINFTTFIRLTYTIVIVGLLKCFTGIIINFRTSCNLISVKFLLSLVIITLFVALSVFTFAVTIRFTVIAKESEIVIGIKKLALCVKLIITRHQSNHEPSCVKQTASVHQHKPTLY